MSILVLFLALGFDQDVEREIFARVNAERVRHSLPALEPDSGLASVARLHNDDMARRGYFSHVNPEGEGPGERVARHDRQLIGEAGENLWSGSGYAGTRASPMAVEIVAGWMRSPGHRANILSREYTHMGIAVSMNHEGVAHATQVFAAVAARLEHPLPASVRRGDALRLEAKGAEMFDLWLPTVSQVVTGPSPIAGAHADAPPGVYRLRFYFPTTRNHFAIRSGPSLEIR